MGEPSLEIPAGHRTPPQGNGAVISNGAKTLLFGVFFSSRCLPMQDRSETSAGILKGLSRWHLHSGLPCIGDSRDGEKVYVRLMGSALERKPHFFIHLGDMIAHPGEREWRTFFEISKPMNVPFFPVVGNHEVSSPSRGEKLYRKQFPLPEGKTYYAFRAGGVFFVILDSEEGRGRIINEQLAWLENILSSSQETFKLVFIHRPLFLPVDSLKRGRAMDRYPAERDALHQLFLKTNVKAVFEADDHRYDRMEKDRILYVITGGGGAPLTSSRKEEAFSIMSGFPSAGEDRRGSGGFGWPGSRPVHDRIGPQGESNVKCQCSHDMMNQR